MYIVIDVALTITYRDISVATPKIQKKIGKLKMFLMDSFGNKSLQNGYS